MKILFLLSSLEPAGSETYCVSLAKVWQRQHEIFWISDRLHFGQPYVSLPISAKALPGGVSNTFKVARFIRDQKIEIVHSHSRRAHWVAAQAAALTHIPHVTTIHQPPPVHVFSKLFPCLGDIAIAIDEAVSDHLQTHFGRKPENIRLIRNGIELPPSPAITPKNNPKRIAILGRLSGGRWAAAQFFFDTLKRISKSLPATHYLVAGRIPETRAQELAEQLRTLNAVIAPSVIESAGWTDHLADFISSCNGIVAAGRSGLESLALGRPVLMMGESGVIGLVGPETWDQALRTNLGDHMASKEFYPAKLEVALRELLDDSAGSTEKARWGRSQVEKYYDIQTVARDIDQVHRLTSPDPQAYHRLLSQAPSPGVDPKRISVSAEQFRAHLRWLKRLGYQTISLADYPERLKSHQPLPSKSFAITFDDGYEEVLTLGLPILQEMGFTAAVFAVPGEFGGANRWDDGKARLMTEDQLRQLQKAGIAIGAHTCSHVHLPHVSSDIAHREITESKTKLERSLGRAVTLFAYPYGDYNEATERAEQVAGFHAAFATDRAPQEHDNHLFHLRRVVIFPRTTVWEILWKVQRWYPRYQDWKKGRPL